MAKEYHFSLETPFEELTEQAKKIILYGTDGQSVKVFYKGQRGEGVYDVAFEGLIKNVQRRYRESSESMKQEYETYMTVTPCEISTRGLYLCNRSIWFRKEFSCQ